MVHFSSNIEFPPRKLPLIGHLLVSGPSLETLDTVLRDNPREQISHF